MSEIERKEMDGSETQAGSKRRGKGRQTRRDVVVWVATTTEIKGRLQIIAADKKISESMLGHKALVFFLEKNPLTDLDYKVAREEEQMMNMIAQEQQATISLQISKKPKKVKHWCKEAIRDGVPTKTVIKDILEPNMEAVREHESDISKWAVKELENLKSEISAS